MIPVINIAHAGVITDAPSFSQIAMNVLQFLLSTVSIFAIIMVIISGTIYFFAAGNEGRMRLAKKSSVYAVIGIIISLSAMVIIRLIGGFLSSSYKFTNFLQIYK